MNDQQIEDLISVAIALWQSGEPLDTYTHSQLLEQGIDVSALEAKHTP